MSNARNKTTSSRVQRPKRNKLWLSIAVALVAVLASAGIWILAFSTGSNNSSDDKISVQKTERSLSGKSADEDRQDAINAATDLLNLAAESPTNEEFDKRLEKLSEGDQTVISPELKNGIRFVDTFENENLQVNVYQSLVTFATLIQQTSGKAVVEPGTVDMWKNVHVDSELGIAFVPIAAYANQSAGFSLEMIYVDGEWKLAPYSLIDSVKLSAKLQLGAEDAAAAE